MSASAAEGYEERDNKNFGDLLTEVFDAGKCTYCLVCLDACSREGCDAAAIVGDTFDYTPSECLGSGICYVSCPELESLDLALEAMYRTGDSEIGHVEKATSAMSGDWSVRSQVHEGSVVPSILKYLFDAGEIDAAVVPAPADMSPSGLLLASQGEETITPTGYKFRKPSTTEFLRDLYRSRERPLRLALVANPCQARMVRKMQLNNVPPSRDVKLIIGGFCYANLSNARWRRTFFERAVGARGRLIRSVDVEDDVRVVFYDGSESRVDLDDLYLAFDSSCLSCVDYSNVLADISVGPVGSPEGFDTLIMRTDEGMRAFEGALKEGYLVEWIALFKREDSAEFGRKLLAEVENRKMAKVELSLKRGRARA
ncbi:MAG: Coenzyme F420 hydrogenase/dehydrogenase, beta subunit C-terminal domain [Thermoplasmata archaeon]